jgi:hypothetical protein
MGKDQNPKEGVKHHKGAAWGQPKFPKNGMTRKQYKRYKSKNGGNTGSFHDGKV